MATPVQRAQAVCDALRNTNTPLTQVEELGRAHAWRSGQLIEFNAMSNSDKALYLINALRNQNLPLIRDYRAETATITARDIAKTSTDTDWAVG